MISIIPGNEDHYKNEDVMIIHLLQTTSMIRSTYHCFFQKRDVIASLTPPLRDHQHLNDHVNETQ